MSKTLHYSEGIVTKQNIFENLNAVNPDTNELKNPPQPVAKKTKARKKKTRSSKANKENSNNLDTSNPDEVPEVVNSCAAAGDVEEKQAMEAGACVDNTPEESVPAAPTSDDSQPYTSSHSPIESDVPDSQLAEEERAGSPQPVEPEPRAPSSHSPRICYPTMQFVNSSYWRGRGGRGGRAAGDYHTRRDASDPRPGRGGEASSKSSDNPPRGPLGNGRPYDRNRPVRVHSASRTSGQDERSSELPPHRDRQSKVRREPRGRDPEGVRGQPNGKPVKESQISGAKESSSAAQHETSGAKRPPGGRNNRDAAKSQNAASGPDGSSRRAEDHKSAGEDQKSPGKDQTSAGKDPKSAGKNQKSPGKDHKSTGKAAVAKADPKPDSNAEPPASDKGQSKTSPKGSKSNRPSPREESRAEKTEKPVRSSDEDGVENKSAADVVDVAGVEEKANGDKELRQDSRGEENRPPPSRNNQSGERRGYAGKRERGYGDTRERTHTDQRERGYDQKDRGYDQRERGYDQKDRGYDQRERGYDQKDRGYDQRDRTYDQKDRGYDQRDRTYDQKDRGYADTRERTHTNQRERDYDQKDRNYDQKDRNYDQKDRSFADQRERGGNRDRVYADPRDRDGNSRGYSRGEDRGYADQRDRGYADQRGEYGQQPAPSRKYYDSYQERGGYRPRRGRGGSSNYASSRPPGGERRNYEGATAEEEAERSHGGEGQRNDGQRNEGQRNEGQRNEGPRNGPRGSYRGNRAATSTQVNGGYVSSEEDRRGSVQNGDNATSNNTSFSRNKRRYGRGNSRSRAYPTEPMSRDPSCSKLEDHSGDGTQRSSPQRTEHQAGPLVNGSSEAKDGTRDADGKTKKWSDESWQDEAPRKPSPYEEQTNRVKVTHEPVEISEGPAYNQTIQEVQGDLLGAPVEYALAVGVSEDFRMPSGLPAQFRNEFRRLDILLDQNVRVGNVASLATPCTGGGTRLIFYLVTKRLSHQRAQLKPLRSCLVNLREACEQKGVRSLALPQLGTGPDRLEWRDVRPLLEEVFEGSGIPVLVYMQSEDQDYSSKSTKVTGAKLVFEQKPVVEIEEFTSILVLTSLDGELNTLVLHSLDEKFKIKDELDAQLATASVGSVICLKRSNYFISVLVVSSSGAEPFRYETIFKCLSVYKKHLHKERLEYVAFEVLPDRHPANEMLNEKLVSFMKNSLPYSIQLHVCWPDYVEDRHSIARNKPPASSSHHQSALSSRRIENYSSTGRYQAAQSAFSTSSQSTNDRPLEIDSNRHFPKL